MPHSSANRSRPVLGLIMIALGGWIVLLALDVIPLDPETLYAPRWVFMMVGLVFVMGGGAVLSAPLPALRSAFVATMLLTFALAGGWVALFSDSDGFSGGIPFLPDAVNVVLARGLFGFGAVVLAACFVYVVRRILRGQSIDGDA